MRNKFDADHIKSICEPCDCYMMAPYMKSQIAVDELRRYFLGANWYDISGVNHTEQINTNIVCEIEQKYKGAKMGRFKHKRFNSEHIWNICDSDGWDGCILSPPMKAEVAIHELCNYFLGDNWYDESGAVHPEQMNTAIVCAIEKKYKGAKILF